MNPIVAVVHTANSEEQPNYWAAHLPQQNSWWFKTEDDTGDLQFVVFRSREECQEAIDSTRPGRVPVEITFQDAAFMAALAGAKKIAIYNAQVELMGFYPVAKASDVLAKDT